MRVPSVMALTLGLVVLVPGCGGTNSAASDSVRCSNVTGTMHFIPPLKGNKVGRRASETVEFTATGTGCSTSDPGAVSVSAAAMNGTITGGTDSCNGILRSTRVRATVNWMPRSLGSSALSFSPVTDLEAGPYASEGDGLAMAGTARVTGAFHGSDGRPRSTINLFSDESLSQIFDRCSSTPGLTALRVTSGSLTIGTAALVASHPPITSARQAIALVASDLPPGTRSAAKEMTFGQMLPIANPGVSVPGSPEPLTARVWVVAFSVGLHPFGVARANRPDTWTVEVIDRKTGDGVETMEGSDIGHWPPFFDRLPNIA